MCGGLVCEIREGVCKRKGEGTVFCLNGEDRQWVKVMKEKNQHRRPLYTASLVRQARVTRKQDVNEVGPRNLQWSGAVVLEEKGPCYNGRPLIGRGHPSLVRRAGWSLRKALGVQ